MPRQGDAQKLGQWQERLDRFEACGLTVVQFCRQEGMSPSRFYYWVKRVRGELNGNGRPIVDSRGRKIKAGTAGTQCKPARTASSRSPACEKASASEPMVHFTLDSKLRVSVPAKCLDAIGCVLQLARQEKDEPCSDTQAAQAFRQVIIGDGV